MRNPFQRRVPSHHLPLLGAVGQAAMATPLQAPEVQAVALLAPPKLHRGLHAEALPPTHAFGFPGRPSPAGARAVPELAVWAKALPVAAIAPPPLHEAAVRFAPAAHDLPPKVEKPGVHVATAWMQQRPVLRFAPPIGRVPAEVAERWLKKLASVKRLDRRNLVLEALFEGVAVAEETPLSYRAGERSLGYVLPLKPQPASVVVVAFDEKAGTRVVGRFREGTAPLGPAGKA